MTLETAKKFWQELGRSLRAIVKRNLPRKAIYRQASDMHGGDMQQAEHEEDMQEENMHDDGNAKLGTTSVT